MKVILPRQDLLEALNAALQVAGGRTTRPILSCVKLTAKKDADAQVSASDGETSLQLGVPVLSLSRAGATVVSADRLAGIVRELNDIEIVLETDERHCIVRGQGSEFRIYTQNPEDFPPVPAFEAEPDLVLDGRVLRQMIVLTHYSAAKETSRYAINGVLWEKQGKRLYLVATDGRRLARAGGPVIESSSADFEAIIPSKALGAVEKVFQPPRDGEPWRIEIKMAPNQAVLRSGTDVMATVLVEGHFPKYQDVIPRDQDKHALVAREDLLSAVRRAALLTTEESRAVRLSFSGDRLVLTSQAPEQGNARVEIPVRYEGANLEIGFNPSFLSDALRVMPFEEVRIDLNEGYRPGVVSGGDTNEFLYVVMPVSLGS